MNDLKVDEKRTLQRIGFIYFVYLFIYSGLEFTASFLMFHKFGFNAIDQAKMFLTTGEFFVFFLHEPLAIVNTEKIGRLVTVVDFEVM